MPNERFEGAITRPVEPQEEAGEAERVVPRPPRPALVELAAALLIIGGLMGVLTLPNPFVPGAGIVPWLFLGMAILTMVVGFLVRAGRGWVLALNVTAIALFLEALALPSPFAILFLAMDAVVFLALLRHRRWFQWSTEAEPAVDDASR